MISKAKPKKSAPPKNHGSFFSCSIRVLVSLTFLSSSFLSNRSVAADACFEHFAPTELATREERVAAWRAQTPAETLDWLTSISQETLGQSPAWASVLNENPAFAKNLKSQFKGLRTKRGPRESKVRKIVAKLYRYSLLDLARRLGRDPAHALDTLSRVPDEVLMLRLERGMMKKGAVDALRSAGLLRDDGMVTQFKKVLGRYENTFNAIGSAILSAPVILSGGTGVLLPKITVAKEDLLVTRYGSMIPAHGFDFAHQKMVADLGSTMTQELRYNFVRQAVNMITIMAFVAFIGDEFYKEFTMMHKRHEEIKQLAAEVKQIHVVPRQATPEDDGDQLLAQYEENLKLEGKTLTPEEREVQRKRFRDVFIQAAAMEAQSSASRTP